MLSQVDTTMTRSLPAAIRAMVIHPSLLALLHQYEQLAQFWGESCAVFHLGLVRVSNTHAARGMDTAEAPRRADRNAATQQTAVSANISCALPSAIRRPEFLAGAVRNDRIEAVCNGSS